MMKKSKNFNNQPLLKKICSKKICKPLKVFYLIKKLNFNILIKKKIKPIENFTKPKLKPDNMNKVHKYGEKELPLLKKKFNTFKENPSKSKMNLEKNFKEIIPLKEW